MKKNTDSGTQEEDLKNLFKKLKTEYRKKWKRDLPFQEYLSDRWERARELGFGKDTSIYQSSYVYGDVKVGKNTWIGPFTILDGTGGLEIGDNCSISSGVHIYSHNSVSWAVTKGKSRYERKPVKVGSYCFIGPNSVIKNGVKIGNHSVVGALSFVNKDVEPFSIMAGNPAKKIGSVKIFKGKAKFIYDKKQK
ncbi:MAG: acyltransferase [Ignavibacteriae bacterium]|nr:acyltransferase [Ignavibacteriota bacterium]